MQLQQCQYAVVVIVVMASSLFLPTLVAASVQLKRPPLQRLVRHPNELPPPVSPPPTRRRNAFLQLAAIVYAAPCLLRPSMMQSFALTADQAELQYDAYAATYDALDGGPVANRVLGLDQARRQLLNQAQGHVLEIGVGTGLNMPYYQPSHIKSLTIVDISAQMLQTATARAQQVLPDTKLYAHQLDATRDLVPTFGSARFDTVVDTFSLCVMGPDGAHRCLDQVARVLRDAGCGHVLLLENNRARNIALAAYQDVTAPAVAMLGGKGCVYNQDVRALLLAATPRFQIVHETEYAAGLFRAFDCVKK